MNRMVHVHLRVAHRDWLEWALETGVHPWVMDYIQMRPDHLWSPPPKHEEPFSTPRSWHMLSDALHEYGERATDDVMEILAYGCLSPHHAGQFKAFVKQMRGQFRLNAILKGDQDWPKAPEDRDILYFLAQSFRAHLVKEFPPEPKMLKSEQRALVMRAKVLLKNLAHISLEIAQMVVSGQEDHTQALPNWFMVEIVRDLPRLVERENGKQKA